MVRDLIREQPLPHWVGLLFHRVAWSLPNTVTRAPRARGLSQCQPSEGACGDAEGKMQVLTPRAAPGSTQTALNFTNLSRFFLPSLSRCIQGTALETAPSSASVPDPGSQAPARLSSGPAPPAESRFLGIRGLTGGSIAVLAPGTSVGPPGRSSGAHCVSCSSQPPQAPAKLSAASHQSS